MTNRGAWGTTINPGGSVTIPAGYHNGGGRVSAGAGNPRIVEVTKGVIPGHNSGDTNKTISITPGYYIAASVIEAQSGATRVLWADGVWGVNIYQATDYQVKLHNKDGNSGGYVVFRATI